MSDSSDDSPSPSPEDLSGLPLLKEEVIEEPYTSDDDRVDRIRLRGPSIVAKLDACNRCSARSPKDSGSSVLLRCSKCKVAKYCCKVCQLEDWVYHKKWCAAFIRSGVDLAKALGRPVLSSVKSSSNTSPNIPVAPVSAVAPTPDAVVPSSTPLVVAPEPPINVKLKKSVKFSSDTKPPAGVVRYAYACGEEETCGCPPASVYDAPPSEPVRPIAVEDASMTLIPPDVSRLPPWMRVYDPFEREGDGDGDGEDSNDDNDSGEEDVSMDGDEEHEAAEVESDQGDAEAIDPHTGRRYSEFGKSVARSSGTTGLTTCQDTASAQRSEVRIGPIVERRVPSVGSVGSVVERVPPAASRRGDVPPPPTVTGAPVSSGSTGATKSRFAASRSAK